VGSLRNPSSRWSDFCFDQPNLHLSKETCTSHHPLQPCFCFFPNTTSLNHVAHHGDSYFYYYFPLSLSNKEDSILQLQPTTMNSISCFASPFHTIIFLSSIMTHSFLFLFLFLLLIWYLIYIKVYVYIYYSFHIWFDLKSLIYMDTSSYNSCIYSFIISILNKEKLYFCCFSFLFFKLIFYWLFSSFQEASCWSKPQPYELILWGWVRLKVHFVIWYQSHFEPILSSVCWVYQVTHYRTVIRPPITYVSTHELVASAWGVC